jgi:hypothetical protein
MIDDAARASAKFRSEIPGRSNQAEKAGSEGLERVKSGVRELVSPPSTIHHFASMTTSSLLLHNASVCRRRTR